MTVRVAWCTVRDARYVKGFIKDDMLKRQRYIIKEDEEKEGKEIVGDLILCGGTKIKLRL